MMTCGHRGIPQRIEEKRISRLLRKSGFIPMLEQAGQAPQVEKKNDFVKLSSPSKTNDSKVIY